MLKTTPNFALFDAPVEIRGGVGEISISFSYDRTSGIHLMAIYCSAAGSGVLIKNKEKKVHG